MAKQKLPRATHEGKIGNVDCYVLEDGRCVLSVTKVVASLQGNPHSEGTNLGQYVARLSKKVDGLAPISTFGFITISGREAIAVDDEAFAEICSAYVRGLVMGVLDPRTIPVAQRAYSLQESWSKLGLRAHILAASGVTPKTAMGQIRSLADKLFLKDPRQFEVLYNSELIDAIRRVYNRPRAPHESKRIPQWMAAIFAKLYRKFLGADGYALLKRRNPHPSQNTALHHQWLVDAILEEIKDHRAAIIYIANRSGKSKKYFWAQIDELLGIATQRMLPAA